MELRVGTHAALYLRRALHINSHPVHRRVHAAELVERVACATAQVEYPRVGVLDPVIGQHLARVVGGHGVADQREQVVADHRDATASSVPDLRRNETTSKPMSTSSSRSELRVKKRMWGDSG